MNKLKRKKGYIVSIPVLFLSLSLSAQDITSVLSKTMDNIRVNKVEAVDTKVLFKAENASAVVSKLQSYAADTLYKVRDKAYNLMGTVARKSTDKKLRSQVIISLCNGVGDKEFSVSRNCLKSLQNFAIADFNTTAKDKLVQYLDLPGFNQVGLLSRLLGFLQVQSSIPKINAVLNYGATKAKGKWEIHLALARLNEQTSWEYILFRVEKAPVNDDFVLEAVPDLVYTRNKQVFEYLITLLNSDEKKCSSAAPDSEEPMVCGYRILEFMAPAIKNFPVKTDSSGDLAGDYKQNLTTAREWFAAKKNNYEFNNEIY